MKEESIRILLSCINYKRKHNEKIIWNLEEKLRIFHAMSGAGNSNGDNAIDCLENIDFYDAQKDLEAIRQEEAALDIAEKELLELSTAFC